MSRLELTNPAQPQGQGPGFDYWLLGATLVLAGLGLVMVLSASGIMADKFWHDKFWFFRKQAVFAAIGFVLMWCCVIVPRPVIYKMVYVWLFLVLAMFIVTAMTPLGVMANGAKRWMAVGPFSVQPLEFSKIALVIYLGYFFGSKQHLVKTFSVGFVPPVMITALMCLCLLLQPDFGGAVFLALILFIMSLVGGTRFLYLGSSLLLALAGGVALVVHSPYRFKRWLTFLDPFKEAKTIGYQLVQSLYAFGSGKLWGAGLGAGKQKLFFLPEAHNDFIMAVVGEELGFIGVTIIIACLGFLMWRSFRIALAQENIQDRFTALGMALILSLGAVLNLAVVLGTVPPKGVPMPFMSYGGSSLIGSFIAVGMLLNLSRKQVTGWKG